jgi:protein gp37
MAAHSSIEWTQSTWNPITGCSKISPGCGHCYAERMALRLQAMGQPNYRNGFRLTVQPQALELPLRWKKPQMVFVNSMGDLFHDKAPRSFVCQIFEVMNHADWHVYQVLTKRSTNLRAANGSLPWNDHIWMGVTVESAEYVYRIDNLLHSGARNRFISFEPLLGPIGEVDLRGIDWVIVGGESGPGARPISREWVLEIRDQCVQQGVPFFFKQWGGTRKKANGRLLDGQTWNQMPEGLREHRRSHPAN